jgi:hypothetical protein
MTPERLRPVIEASSKSSTPLTGKAAIPVNKRDDEFDVGDELSGFGLQGVQVSQDDLAALVEELGLGGDEAKDLVEGLSGSALPEKTKVKNEAKSAEENLARVLTSSVMPKMKGAATDKAVDGKPTTKESAPAETQDGGAKSRDAPTSHSG